MPIFIDKKMKFHHKENFLCFPKEELLRILEISNKKELMGEVFKQGFSFEDLMGDYSKMEKISDIVGERWAQDRDQHEIFAAAFVFHGFYEEGSEICFELKGFDSKIHSISSAEDLNKFRQEVGTSDFIIKSDGMFRVFQLKRYRGDLTIEKLSEFIKEKVRHYGNNLGSTNLLIIFQSDGYEFDLDFEELSKKVKSFGFEFEGEILVSFNQANKENIIIRLYPEIGKAVVPLKLPSSQIKGLDNKQHY